MTALQDLIKRAFAERLDTQRIQARLMALQFAANRVEGDDLALARSFALRHWTSGGPDTNQVYRAITGILRALRRVMTPDIRRVGRGDLRVTADPGRCLVFWSENPSAPLVFGDVAREAALRDGEMDDATAALFAEFLVQDLLAGSPVLPEYRAIRTSDGIAGWVWQQQEVVPNEVDEAAAGAELDRLLKAAAVDDGSGQGLA